MMSRPLSVALAAACLTCTPHLARGQGAGPGDPPAVIEGPGFGIAVSRSGKTLYGYSVHTGTWEGVAVANPDRLRLTPVLGGGVGYVAAGKWVYAFSAKTGHWAPIELPEAVAPTLFSDGRIKAVVDTRVFMFSGVTGGWASVDLAADEPGR